ncbi:MAG: helix-turn-helix domain-containing protein [Chroococcidiopsidaceae cyanobacterium CP_BM_RX_35]|nr:helix-turn-helix domain-containing protein [Chroococcidiopsidaceae cyanobacterium CP_BM_RX_35]
MKLRRRSQQIFEAIKEGGKRSIRKIAEATGIAKSSVHRHQQAMRRRNQYSESELWETAVGGEWLRLLVLGTIYIFGIKCGIGVETLSEFFYLLQLPMQVGVSPSALHKLEAEVRERILQYQQEQQSLLGQSQTAIEICAAADETAFEQDVLVLMDLKSGYILVEEQVENRQYDTWLDKAQTALTQVGVRVRSLVSDPPALIKLALEGFKCPSVADLFHPLWDLSKSVGAALSRQLGVVLRSLSLSAKARYEVPNRFLELELCPFFLCFIA